MCTAREVCALLRNVEEVGLGWDGNMNPFSPDDEVHMDAFGDYGVKEIEYFGEKRVTLNIAVTPVKVK